MSGLGLLSRLALRRSRWYWTAWVLLLAVTPVATVSKYDELMGGDPRAARATADVLAHTVAMRAMLGTPYDLLHPGPFVMWRVGTFVAVCAALMGALGVIRATRAEEEDGRAELVRAGAVGRDAPLAAGMLVASLASALLGLLVAATTAAQTPVLGSVVMGAGIALVGLVGAAVGAVAAQLSSTARGARGIASAVIGVAYLVRALGDADPGGSLAWLSWLSPLDWAALARPYAGDRVWVLLLPAALALALGGLAVVLSRRRDFGSGVLSARPGPTDAPRLDGGLRLAWRLERGSFLGWLLGVTVSMGAFGTIAGGIEDLLRDNPQVADMFRRMGAGASDLRDAFYVAILGIVAPVVTLLGVQAVTMLRREEERGHAELLLATSLTRTRLLAGHVLLAVLAPAVLMAVGGGALALGSHDPHLVLRLAGAGLALTPGCWVVVGVATLLLGWLPRRLWLAWVVLGWSTFVVWLGGVVGLPHRVLDLTPWAGLPALPGEPMAWGAVAAVTAVAAGAVVLGTVGYRRRDLPA